MLDKRIYILGSQGYYSVAWHDAAKATGITYFNSMLVGCHNTLQRLLTRWCFSLRWGKLCPPILRQQIYNRLLPISETTGENCFFLFFESWYAVYTTDYIDYLRHRYPKAQLVLYLQDVVSSNPCFEQEIIRRRFNRILTYDKGDAMRYDLQYAPTPYSRLDIAEADASVKCDVFFCGHAKNRLPRIMQAYEAIKQAGLTCRFYITGVPRNEQKVLPDIIYNTPMPYTEIVRHIAGCKAILEIMQRDADGYTARLWEAISYNKHLLTDNRSIRNSCFDSPAIHLIDESLDYRSILLPARYPESLRSKLSPLRWLQTYL